jgi:hypothetical protein
VRNTHLKCPEPSVTPVLRHEGKGRAAMTEADSLEWRELIETSCDKGGSECNGLPADQIRRRNKRC